MLYIFFHPFIHVYSPGAAADNPWGSKFWYQQKHLVASVICCKFLPLNDFLTFFLEKFIFSHIKSIKKQIWPCRKKRSRSTQGHHFNKLCWAQVPDAAYQAQSSLALWFQRRRFLKGFYHIYGHGSHLAHVTQTPPPPYESGKRTALWLVYNLFYMYHNVSFSKGAVWSGSTLFAIPSASFGCIFYEKSICVKF